MFIGILIGLIIGSISLGFSGFSGAAITLYFIGTLAGYGLAKYESWSKSK